MGYKTVVAAHYIEENILKYNVYKVGNDLCYISTLSKDCDVDVIIQSLL
jgi:hypothetical protein